MGQALAGETRRLGCAGCGKELTMHVFPELEEADRILGDEAVATGWRAVGSDWYCNDCPDALLHRALERLTRVGGEFSANMAGPHWEELCAALSEARAALRATPPPECRDRSLCAELRSCADGCNGEP